MKALVGAFNQEKALVGAFFVIVQSVVEPMDRFTALILILIRDIRESPGITMRGWNFMIQVCNVSYVVLLSNSSLLFCLTSVDIHFLGTVSVSDNSTKI